MSAPRSLILLFAFAIVTAFTSCNKDIQKPDYRIASIEEVTVEAEPSTVDIQMSENDWVITGIYSLSGHTITDGHKPLQLTGLGTLTSHWFKVTRNELSSLRVDIFENFDDIERGMVIKIEQGSHTEEIKILQVTSQGYQFKEIKYSFREKSTFSRGGESPKLIDNNYTDTESPVTMYPYKSAREISSFKSDDEGAFNWAGEEGVEVNIPTPSNEKYFYKKSTTNHPSQLDDVTFTVGTPPGKQLKVMVEIEYLKQIYDYTLVLINNRTQEEKEIKGEWTIEQPISYKETLEVGELPER